MPLVAPRKPQQIKRQQAKPQAKARGGSASAFEQAHPRGRGGKWIVKPADSAGGPDQTTAQLQQRLNQLGFRVPVSGRYDPATSTAVKAFQARYGLDTKEGVDAATLEFLQNPPSQTIAQIQRAKATTTATTTAKTTTTATTKTVKATTKAASASAAASAKLTASATAAKQAAKDATAAAKDAQTAAADAKKAGATKDPAAARKAARAAQAASDAAQKISAAAQKLAAANKSNATAVKDAKSAAASAKSAASVAAGANKAATAAWNVAVRQAQAPAPGEVAVLARGTIRAPSSGSSAREKLTPPKSATTPKSPTGKVQVATSAPQPREPPDLEETLLFGFGGQPSLAIPDGRERTPAADLPIWTRAGLADRPDLTIPDGRTVQALSVELGEAVAARKAASTGIEFTRALARERVLRAWLAEAEWQEFLHPRSRTGTWIKKFGTIELGPSAEKPKKALLPGDKPTLFESTVCSKCGGEGKIYTYSNVLGGVCFKCHGRGRVLTARGQKAQNYYRDLLSKRADELKPGDKIWDDGVPGFTQPGWKEVQSVTPNKDGTLNVKAEGSGLANAPASHKFRVQHTLGEKKAAAEKAKAYQATLPAPKPKPKKKPTVKKPTAKKVAKPKPPTAKQMEFVKKLAAEHGVEVPPGMSRAEASKFIDDHVGKAKPKLSKGTSDVIEGDAVEIAGRVVSASYKDTPYGAQPKVLIADDRGFRVYGTLPRKLEDELSTRAQNTGDPNWAKYIKAHPELRIRLTGGTKRSPKDSTFGFFSRPKNASFEDALQEASWREFLHPRGRGGKWIQKLGGPHTQRRETPASTDTTIGKIIDSLHGRTDADAYDALAGGEALDTQKLHQVDGKYTAERQQLHQEIIDHFFADARPVRSGKPKAVFTAGGAASGKSALAGQASEAERNLDIPNGAVYVNPDDIKELLPEYDKLKQMGREDIAAAATHEESSDLAKLMTKLALAGNYPIVVDGTGDSAVGKFGGKLQAAADAGYDVEARYAHVPVDEALRREKIRAQKTGRKVAEALLRSQHKTVAKSYREHVVTLPNVHIKVYSTVKRGRPTLIAEQKPGQQIKVLDKRQYAEHLAKADA